MHGSLKVKVYYGPHIWQDHKYLVWKINRINQYQIERDKVFTLGELWLIFFPKN